MGLNLTDLRLLAAIQDGLPLDPRPYARVAEQAGLTEDETITRLDRLAREGVIRRFGVVVRHHELGYRANAMVVWDVPDAQVRDAGRRHARLPYVTLSYRRQRSRPHWTYKHFCKNNGRNRARVEAMVEEASAAAGLGGFAREILFSRKRFKQRGARYAPGAPELKKAG